MENHILSPLTGEMLKGLSKKEVCTLLLGEQSIRLQMQQELDKIKSQYKDLENSLIDINGQFVRLKSKLFMPSSEKSKSEQPSGRSPASQTPKNKKRENHSKLPSERYPNAPVIEKELQLENLPTCKNCDLQMQDSGMKEVSEYLEVTPKKFTIIRQIRHKYRCKCCQGSVLTTPQLPRIKPGSVYSDAMIIDISMSKYCDLNPVERYAAMAAREGLAGLPANSLIEATHHLAEFLLPAARKIKEEVLNQVVILADETPHKMLEGDARKNWFLWGFSCLDAAFFECVDTRSGDVSSHLLKDSKAQVLLSDVYSGYIKTVRVVNKHRQDTEMPLLKAAYCNAHARRKFKDAEQNFPELAGQYIRCFRVIYRLEKRGKETGQQKKHRKRMRWIFDKMFNLGTEDILAVSEKSELAKAIKYFQNNFTGLTLFLDYPEVPIDNNSQESLLRNPVIGRKTWYGTHSKRGAQTAAILFSITQTCKLNKINPREYVIELVKELHLGKPPFTPREFKEREIT
jgi:transposase